MFGISQDILYLVVSNNSSSIALTLTPVLWIKTDWVHNDASYMKYGIRSREKSLQNTEYLAQNPNGHPTLVLY